MVSIKSVKKKDNFFFVDFRPGSQFDTVRTPDWAERVAQSESSGAKVRMGKTSAGNWLVEEVLIERGHGKDRNDARRLARRIQQKIESE